MARRWEHLIPLSLPFLLFFTVSMAFASPASVQRLSRPDPSHHLKSYHGGYNITNHHYWTSTIYTGIHGYTMATLWMVLGVGVGIYVVLKNSPCYCCKKENNSTTNPTMEHLNSTIYRIIFILIILFSILGIVACSLSIAMNKSSLKNTKKVTKTILGAGAEAQANIENVTRAMDQMQTYLTSYSPSVLNLLNVTSHLLEKDSRTIGRFIRQSEPSIYKALQISYTTNLAVVLINLVFIVATIGKWFDFHLKTSRLMDCCFGPVLLFLHWYPGLIMIILLCWLFTAFCWVLTGFDFFLHVFAEDTCFALQDFEKNPNNNSLMSLLPCVNASYATSVLSDIGLVAHTFIQTLNSKMANFKELLGSYDKYEASSSAIICDPFSNPNYTFNMDICPKGAIQVGDIPNIMSSFTCFNNKNISGECVKEGKFVSEDTFSMVSAYSHAIQDLIDMFPDFESLLRCAFVKDIFSEVILHDCRPYKASTKRLWGSMLSFSIIMVILVLLWVIRAYQEKGRSFLPCSITPNNINNS
ncbi:uncharacterized protein LOC124916060 [Impatiens glandulifera]|uniref:uncharacterized protein LOC124916060 n=1 Tax=Impatiens glandulifera TaxID=253017 RepID=UPI001FB1882E|nr:uncharacterized protein LOC124916060 [Impatiens glandulifera]